MVTEHETGAAVLPSGKVKRSEPQEGTSTGVVAVGSHVLMTTNSGTDGDPSGPATFAGQGWDSTDAAPSSEYNDATITGSDADHMLVANWASSADPNGIYKGLDSKTGKVLSAPDCRADGLLTSSPNRQWFVFRGLRVTAEGQATCIGGGDGEKTVDLTTVTNEGRAFGTDDTFVDVSADGTPTTSTLPEGAAEPIGVMEGGLVINWDEETGAVVATPIKG